MCFKALHLWTKKKEENAVNSAYFMYLDQKVTSNQTKVILHLFYYVN